MYQFISDFFKLLSSLRLNEKQYGIAEGAPNGKNENRHF
jgi:hypothetical protein